MEERLMRPRLRLGGDEYQVGIIRRSPEVCLDIDGSPLQIGQGSLSSEMTVNGQTHRCITALDGDVCHIRLHGRTIKVELIDPRDATEVGGKGDSNIAAPMPGAVVSTDCAVGDHVAEGDVVLTIESMKLQMALTAPRDAVVSDIAVAAGDTFDKGQVLVTFATDGQN
jgi:acetyl/propionyl-CoA carboxylase alpha subunit